MTLLEDVALFNTRVDEMIGARSDDRACRAVVINQKLKTLAREATDEEWPEVERLFERVYRELLDITAELPEDFFSKHRGAK